MTRVKWNPVVDMALAAAFLAMVLTGFILEYPLPPGAGRHALLWGLDRHAWGELHFYASLALMALLALHLFLHWRWIEATVRRRFGFAPVLEGGKSRTGIAALGLLAALICLFAWATFAGVTTVANDPDRSPARDHAPLHRRGD